MVNAEDIDLEKALLDPSAVFGSPKDVLGIAGLSAEDKRAILARWAEDAEDLMRATEEGMPTSGNRAPGDLLRAVQMAIEALDQGRGSTSAP